MSETGDAIQHAMVAIVGPSEQHEVIEDLRKKKRLQVTSTDGCFQCEEGAAPNLTKVRVLVRHAAYLPKEARLSVGEKAEIVLACGLTISGRVVQGLTTSYPPVAGVRVVARGVGASAIHGRPEFLAPRSASVQSARTDDSGEFQITGLAAGWYQVNTCEPGLVVSPEQLPSPGDRGQALSLHTRTVYARAGESGLKIAVVPLAVIAVKLLDGATGEPVARGTANPILPNGWIEWPEDLLNNSRLVLVNGVVISARRSSLAGSCFAFFAIPDHWPLNPDTRVRVQVSAAAHDTREVDVPVRMAGSDNEVRGETVRLRPLLPMGLVRCRLRDLHSSPIAGLLT